MHSSHQTNVSINTAVINNIYISVINNACIERSYTDISMHKIITGLCKQLKIWERGSININNTRSLNP